MGVLNLKAEFYDSCAMNPKGQESENIQGMISKKPGGKPPSHND